MTSRQPRMIWSAGAVGLAVFLGWSSDPLASEHDLAIERALWVAEDSRLVVLGKGRDDDENLLFPVMPPAVDGNGDVRDPVQAQGLLDETCYQCHPGRRTDCLRGAMSNGGMLCQDCHGNMAQVGDDFSRTVGEPDGGFELAASTPTLGHRECPGPTSRPAALATQVTPSTICTASPILWATRRTAFV